MAVTLMISTLFEGLDKHIWVDLFVIIHVGIHPDVVLVDQP